MTPFLRLIKLIAPFKWWMALGVILSFLTTGSSVGLMAMSAYLISKAALAADLGGSRAERIGAGVCERGSSPGPLFRCGRRRGLRRGRRLDHGAGGRRVAERDRICEESRETGAIRSVRAHGD